MYYQQLPFYLNYYLELIVSYIYFPISGNYLFYPTSSFIFIMLQQACLLFPLYTIFHYYLKWEESNKLYNTKHYSNKLYNLIVLLNNLLVTFKIAFIVNFSYYILFKFFNLLKFLAQFSILKEYFLIITRLNHLKIYQRLFDKNYLKTAKIISDNLNINTNWATYYIHKWALETKLINVKEQLSINKYSLTGLLFTVGPLSLYILRLLNYLLTNNLGWGIIKINIFWNLMDIFSSFICLITGIKTYTANTLSNPLKYWNWYELFDKTFINTKSLNEIFFRVLFDCFILSLRLNNHLNLELPLPNTDNQTYQLMIAHCCYQLGVMNRKPLNFLLSFIQALVKTHRLYSLYLYFKPKLIIHMRQISDQFNNFVIKIHDFFKVAQNNIMNNPIIKFNIDNNPNLYWIQNLQTIYLKNENKLSLIQDRMIVNIIYFTVALFINRKFYFKNITRIINYQDIVKFNYLTLLSSMVLPYIHNINPSIYTILEMKWSQLLHPSLLIENSAIKQRMSSMSLGLTPINILLCNLLQKEDVTSILKRNINYLWLNLWLIKIVIIWQPLLTEKAMENLIYLMNRIRNYYVKLINQFTNNRQKWALRLK